MISKPRLAIGPVTHLPSWEWIGASMLDHLREHFELEAIDSKFEVSALQAPQVSLIIKSKPTDKVLEQLVARGSKLIYCPVDRYKSADEISADRDFLSACSAVLIHCERLRPYLEPFCKNVSFVEHHNKFGLSDLAPYRAQGPVLWIGGFENLPYLLLWLEKNPIAHEITALCNYKHAPAVRAARSLATELGLRMQVSASHANGVSLREWSVDLQRTMLEQAKAAIDIKGSQQDGIDDFRQMTKPPTKAQKFIASGIPFAINPSSYSAEYFARQGFALATPDDTAWWFSHEYWQQTQNEARELRPRLSLDRVAQDFKERIGSVI